ncbi:MAG: cytochrome ubiquinol oxidase subunit I [Candidatus Pacebacteria bacterium]|nr:cytochrome ubiquinol oxidase subunit I [Candidatus Paceibacterota bacterium]
MDIVAFGRAFLGITMAFHIFFALFGVGIPLLVSLAELIGIVRKDGDFTRMAQRWTFAMAAFFVAGAISGTVLAVVFAVLLPPFMAIVSRVVILPFYIETFAFFIEAIFLGIYAYTWDRFKGKWTHWLASLPIVVASCASAFFITTVNAWMSAPQGFSTDAGGAITGVDQWAAMWNAAVPTRTGHSILSYYATTAFVFAALAAFRFVRKGWKDKNASHRRHYEKMLVFSIIAAFVFSLAVVATGDDSARYIAQHEPEKFAAAEDVVRTGSDEPFVFGGPVAVPGALSFLVGGSEATVVEGLNAFDPATWPPLGIHYLFDVMIAIGVLMLAVPAAFLIFRFVPRLRAKHGAFSKAMSWPIVITGAASVVAVEAGWMFTEIGRQPYTINGFLLTQNAFTNSHAAIAYAVAFPVFYAALAIATITVVAGYYRRNEIV